MGEKYNTTRVAMGHVCDTITMTAIWLKHKLNDGNFKRQFEPKSQDHWDKAQRRWEEAEQVKKEKRLRRFKRKSRSQRMLLPGKVSVTEKVLTVTTATTGIYLIVMAIARVFGLAAPGFSFFIALVKPFWH